MRADGNGVPGLRVGYMLWVVSRRFLRYTQRHSGWSAWLASRAPGTRRWLETASGGRAGRSRKLREGSREDTGSHYASYISLLRMISPLLF